MKYNSCAWIHVIAYTKAAAIPIPYSKGEQASEQRGRQDSLACPHAHGMPLPPLSHVRKNPAAKAKKRQKANCPSVIVCPLPFALPYALR